MEAEATSPGFFISGLQFLKKTDRAVALFALLIAGVFTFLSWEEAGLVLTSAAHGLLALVPVIGLSAALASALTAAGTERFADRWLRGPPLALIAGASALGALTPLCFCTVIPLVGSLLAAGIPLPMVIGFWLSSPVMSPDVFVLTVGGIDLEFALAQTASALLIGLAGGLATAGLQRLGWLQMPLRQGALVAATDFAANPLEWRFWRSPSGRAQFATGWLATTGLLLKWLSLAVLLEALLAHFAQPLPPASLFASDHPFAVPLASLAGIPIFVNGYAAIPIMKGFLDLGVDRAVVLAFTVSGAITSLPACIAVWGLVRARVFLTYLILAAAGSTAAGLLYRMTF